MIIIRDLAVWRNHRQQQRPETSIGFVPTMGALHQGHLSLIDQSRRENTITAVSVFVNPTQFNQAEDFKCYPRPLEADLALLEKAGVDWCLVPEQDAMVADDYAFQVTETQFSREMEGRHRSGHFNGVLTIVMKLFNLVKPSRAYFGEKDYQQFQLIHDMARALFMDVDVKACPTIREPSGLALSSRNLRLTPEQHQLASTFATLFHQPLVLNECIEKIRALGIAIDYVEEHAGRRFAAIKIGDIRLIDNYQMVC